MATQITAKLPFTVDVVFESKSVVNRNDKLVGSSYTKALEWHRSRFNRRFEDTFSLRHKG